MQIPQKQKFDDIFSATRYSKALDAIKKLRKEKMVSTTPCFAGSDLTHGVRLQDEVKDQKIQLAEKKARVETKNDILKRKRRQENQIAELQAQMVEYEEDFAENQRVRSARRGRTAAHANLRVCRRNMMSSSNCSLKSSTWIAISKT